MGVRGPHSEPQSSDTEAAKAFTAAYRDRFGVPPARWAAEAYDAVGLVIAALDAHGGGAGITPGQVVERLFELRHDRVDKPIRFTQDLTHALEPENTSFLHQGRGPGRGGARVDDGLGARGRRGGDGRAEAVRAGRHRVNRGAAAAGR
ncbi:ABC transporter substrate-binding protein [Streptomyces deccanensis]|nr:ABC transporter substrate-binding protein [Streptomyces deccanensis]ULR56340.1 ABC transporter substrate-binding protein [Streptomyces deccanensis]